MQEIDNHLNGELNTIMVKVSKPLSREYLVSRECCCGSGCKNCPYDPPHEKETIEIWECKPDGECWCMEIPTKLEIKGDKCLSPSQLEKVINEK